MKNIENAILRIDEWIEYNGFAGWDPYDIKSTSLYMKASQLDAVFIRKCVKKCINTLALLCPLKLRSLLKIEKQVNAKAMGLFLTSYTKLYDLTQEPKYLERAENCASWLIANRCKDYQGWSWGYPFDWHSVRFIPAGTPSSVVTRTVGKGFYNLYLITRNPLYLDICTGICEFFTKSLRITYEDNKSLCFSYTPIDNYQVHNSNLFVAEFLACIGNLISNQLWLDTAISCGRFALSQQHADGFLPYWGLDQTGSHSKGKIKVDHYHSGFEIRMLYSLWKHTDMKEFKNAYQAYFLWYLNNMFTSHNFPKMNPNTLYPINIHACAEAVLCLSTLYPDHHELKYDIMNLVDSIIKKMEFLSGLYIYEIRYFFIFGEIPARIPMIRWGQAWMLRAFTEAFVQLKTD